MASLLATAACGGSPQHSWVQSLPTVSATIGPPQPAGLVAGSVAWWSPDSVAVLDELETNVAVVSLIDGGRRHIGRKGGGPREFRSVGSIAVGKSAVFVGDPVAATLVVLSPAGVELGRVDAFGATISLLPWAGDTAALVLYGAPALPAHLVLVAATDSGWAIVRERDLETPPRGNTCPSQRGQRSEWEVPLAAAAQHEILRLDPFTLGGWTSSWSDTTATPIAPLCPPLGPMTKAQRQRALDITSPAYASLKPADVKAMRSAVDAYSRLLQPIMIYGRLSRARDGRWWAPLELERPPGALLGIGGATPLRIEIPEEVVAVDWQLARRDSMIGVVLVRDDNDELFLRRIAAPIAPLATTRP